MNNYTLIKKNTSRRLQTKSILDIRFSSKTHEAETTTKKCEGNISQQNRVITYYECTLKLVSVASEIH